jgi:glycerophosphoryl diester phosphodiesterase
MVHPFIAAMRDGEMLVFGHRGARAYAPMNTLPSFELALTMGVHGIECDVQRTLDGVPVLVNEPIVSPTTDGHGYVAQMTYADLLRLDAGSWFAPRFAGTRIPTLDQLFELVGRRAWLNIEIKSLTYDTDGIEALVADRIRQHNMADRVLVSSFNPFALQRFRAILPDIPLAFVYARESPPEVLDIIADMAYEAYHPDVCLVTPESIAPHLAAGRIITPWAVNDGARARTLHSWGMQAVISDVPDVILAALK